MADNRMLWSTDTYRPNAKLRLIDGMGLTEVIVWRK
jgi:hypothetical protein